ncbi:MAG: NapC/NirT family cytochrome c [Bacillota bacterium]|nr:NapC/NirT family cytochrome c [Bacillota bacterium]
MEDEQNQPKHRKISRITLYKILAATLGILIVFGFAVYGTAQATSSSGFCNSCHEMNPEAETWKVSTHSQVACKECHIQPGIINEAKAKINGLDQVYQKVTDNYTAPIKIKDPIPNSVCEKCHNMKNKTTAQTVNGIVVIPHQKHLEKGVLCVQCHYNVVHGGISEGKETLKSEYDKWNSAQAKQVVYNDSFIKPKMEDCIKCHKVRKVSTACSTCHITGSK